MRAWLSAYSPSSTEGSLPLSKTIGTNITKHMKSQTLRVSTVMTSWLRERCCYFLEPRMCTNF
ncbi:DEHA2F12782p [Debaryomyces hansenii CBS767]|uniref:DEHA2F12782p n=1 Tax=Debaryomyces hansenii (strain ATCC 36239 / CBS 767 / BCRC 21394 / JCM 1990 / NBRC 0083 / IGC 2968) TaxID=284592 RepID=B5RUF6_DEBHA|nr:DEHA2F12782p [Debaryomyces hansenii CBS767]CAR66334.1 DEHA2F12782p [Debaryomyces hansenii CBS767]|eukprot:XP_002770810.1 DEHA2F12782p [Debaryomyces hansenii CBS767]